MERTCYSRLVREGTRSFNGPYRQIIRIRQQTCRGMHHNRIHFLDRLWIDRQNARNYAALEGLWVSRVRILAPRFWQLCFWRGMLADLKGGTR